MTSAGAMTPLGRSNVLLRIDVSNTGSSVNQASVALDLAGYGLDGFPTLPAGAACDVFDGLVCSIDSIEPGRTVTLVLLLHPDGAIDAGGIVEVSVSVSSLGVRRLSPSIGRVAVNRPAIVTDEYLLARP